MGTHYRYLPVSSKELWWRYGLIYIAFAVLTVLSYKPLLQVSLWYWLICAPLFLAESYGSYWTLQDDVLAKRFFSSGLAVPLKSVTRIIKGPPFGLAHTASMYCYYIKEDGTEKYLLTTLPRHNAWEVTKFLTDIAAANPKIAIDPELRKWIEGQSQAPRTEKNGIPSQQLNKQNKK